MEPREIEAVGRCFQCHQPIPTDAPWFRRKMTTGVRVSRSRGLVARAEWVILCALCELTERAATAEPPPPPIPWRGVSVVVGGAIVATLLIPRGEWLFWGVLAGRRLWRRWHPAHGPSKLHRGVTQLLRHRRLEKAKNLYEQWVQWKG